MSVSKEPSGHDAYEPEKKFTSKKTSTRNKNPKKIDR